MVDTSAVIRCNGCKKLFNVWNMRTRIGLFWCDGCFEKHFKGTSHPSTP